MGAHSTYQDLFNIRYHLIYLHRLRVTNKREITEADGANGVDGANRANKANRVDRADGDRVDRKKLDGSNTVPEDSIVENLVVAEDSGIILENRAMEDPVSEDLAVVEDPNIGNDSWRPIAKG